MDSNWLRDRPARLSQDDVRSRLGPHGELAERRAAVRLATTRRSPNEKVVVAVVGVNGRGVVHAQNFAKFDELASRLHLRRGLARVSKGIEAVRRTQPDASRR